MRLRDDLRSRIKSGEYGPGDRLPTENELTKKFETSKSPVRQALDTLRMRELFTVTREGAPLFLPTLGG
jgi:GntR family transcriptional regulator